jgi:hypothetical protein
MGSVTIGMPGGNRFTNLKPDVLGRNPGTRELAMRYPRFEKKGVSTPPDGVRSTSIKHQMPIVFNRGGRSAWCRR